MNIVSVEFPLNKFLNFVQNSLSLSELRRFLNYENYSKSYGKFSKVSLTIQFYLGIRPDLKNHVGAPESFYSGQIGLFLGGGLKFDDGHF